MSQQATPDRILGIGILASLVAGLVAGISARIVMWIVAVIAHRPLEFTVGTFNVVFIGFMIGLSPDSSTLPAFTPSAVLRRPKNIFPVLYGGASSLVCSSLWSSDSPTFWAFVTRR